MLAGLAGQVTALPTRAARSSIIGGMSSRQKIMSSTGSSTARAWLSSSTAAASSSGTTEPPQMTLASINQNLVNAEYAVRGEIVIRAGELDQQLKQPDGGGLPFDEIVYCNIGNPQQLAQKPVTFFREVLALCTHPSLLDHPECETLFTPEACARARVYLEHIPGGTGAYSHSMGVSYFRQEIADFISNRDGYPSDAENIFMTDGASPAVQYILKALIRNNTDGIMIPIPQYPLYSACITLCGGQQVQYYLDEGGNWGMDIAELQRSIDEARARGVNTRALAVINPGNPTGQCMTEENIQDVIDFAIRNRLVVMADEVYQENTYVDLPFHSFKKVACASGAFDRGLELVSFHSVSKGFLGECGRRGGYMEVTGLDDEVHAELYKACSVNLCSNLDGQIMMGLMVNPPKEDSPANELYSEERDGILKSLQRRASVIAQGLNDMEGVQCNEVQGALYAFPSITLPPKAIAAAEAAGKAADGFYCMALLEATGIVVVPGSGFGQKDGTWHFRTTILPQEDQIASVIHRMKEFHDEFLAKYS